MSPYRFRRTALARAARCIPLSLLPFAFSSAAEPVEEVQLETIVITADPFARTADRLTQPTEILGGEELERRRAATLGETLEHTPGVSTTDFGRGAGRPVIRGQGGPRVLMLENGLGTMDASDVSPDHDVGLDPAHAEQIEILKGPATLLYDSGASAGVVNVVDGRLPEEWEPGAAAHLRSAYGTNADDRSVAGRATYGLRGGTQLGVDGAWRDAGDYDADDGRRVRNSDVEKKSGSVFAAQFWDRASVAASAGRYETTYGLPVEERVFIDLEQDRFDVEARLRQPIAGWESMALRAALGDYEHTEYEAPGEPGTVFRNDQSELRFEAVHAPFAGLSGVIGVQRRDREFRAIGEEAFTPSTDSRALGVFLVERAPTAFGSVELGVRLDRDHHEPLDAATRPARRFAPVSFSGGALFELSERYHLKLYATRAERAPAVEELYAFGPHLATASFERGDADARTERAHNIEIAVDRHGDALSWRVNLFAQRIANFLYAREVDAGLDADGSGAGAPDGVADRVDEAGTFDPAGELLLLDYTADDARFWGGEGEVTYAWRGGSTQWRARAFGDLVRGRIDDGGNLPRMTPARLGAGLHAHRGAWSASLDLTRVMRQSRTATLESRTDGHFLLSADVDWTVPAPGGSLTLFLRGRNLLDEDARRHTSFIKDVAPLAGVDVIVGVEWRLD